MNRKVAAKVRNSACKGCRLSGDLDYAVDEVCITGSGPRQAKIMVVGKVPNSSIYRENLEADLRGVGLDPKEIFFTAAVKCRNSEADANKTMVKACKPYLDAEIDVVKPDWILTQGNEALQAVTGHSGVMTYRGRVIAHASGASVIPTISPSAVLRNPGQRQSYVADLNFFVARVLGKPAKVAMPKLALVKTRAQLRSLKKLLETANLLSLDIETWSSTGDEFGQGARIISLAGTCVHTVDGELGAVDAGQMGAEHFSPLNPDSPPGCVSDGVGLCVHRDIACWRICPRLNASMFAVVDSCWCPIVAGAENSSVTRDHRSHLGQAASGPTRHQYCYVVTHAIPTWSLVLHTKGPLCSLW